MPGLCFCRVSCVLLSYTPVAALSAVCSVLQGRRSHTPHQRALSHPILHPCSNSLGTVAGILDLRNPVALPEGGAATLASVALHFQTKVETLPPSLPPGIHGQMPEQERGWVHSPDLPLTKFLVFLGFFLFWGSTLCGTGDTQRDSRESIRANHSQLKPLFL